MINNIFNKYNSMPPNNEETEINSSAQLSIHIDHLIITFINTPVSMQSLLIPSLHEIKPSDIS